MNVFYFAGTRRSFQKGIAGVLGLLMLVGFASTSPAQTVTIQMSQVGNPGNLADQTTNNDGSSGHGSVGYTYYIGSYDITVAQYTAFLNAVALTDQYSLYNPNMASDQNIGGIQQSGTQGAFSYSVIGESGSDPITYVSWLDAARFCNWLENGQPTTGIENIKTTEEGSYTLNGDTDLFGESGSETKNPGSIWWIPTEDEWYKAAYYDPTLNEQTGNYWGYATRSNNPPGNVIGATPDQANYIVNGNGNDNANVSGTGYSVTQNPIFSSTQNYLTPVGSFTASASFYMTYDQSGDVYQWSDSILGTQERGLRGGAWSDGATGSTPLSSAYRFEGGPTMETNYIGFRVASSTQIPVISSTLSATGTADFPFAYQIQATGGATSFFATGLPTGLSVTGSTGLISGTPGQTGTFGVTIGASNVAGPGTATLSLVLVAPPAPVISSALERDGHQRAPIQLPNPRLQQPRQLRRDRPAQRPAGRLGHGRNFRHAERKRDVRRHHQRDQPWRDRYGDAVAGRHHAARPGYLERRERYRHRRHRILLPDRRQQQSDQLQRNQSAPRRGLQRLHRIDLGHADRFRDVWPHDQRH